MSGLDEDKKKMMKKRKPEIVEWEQDKDIKTKKRKVDATHGEDDTEINSHTPSEATSSAKPGTNHKHSAEEAEAWKKRKKFFQKKRMQQPKFFLLQGQPTMNGEQNGIDDNNNDKAKILKRREPVSLTEVLYLLEYGLIGNYASFRPSWCKLLRVGKVAKVVLIVLNGVTSRVYRRKRHCFPNIARRTVSTKITPAYSYFAMLQNLLSHRKSKTRFDLSKRRVIREAKKEEEAQSAKKKKAVVNGEIPEVNGEDGDNPPLPGKEHYLVSNEDRESRGHPKRDDDNCVHTRHSDSVSQDSPLFGIDCEMVLTSAGSELARVSLTDEDGKVLYNSLVKPENPIRDYLTKYSGMTKALLDPVDTRLSDVQKAIVDLLPPDAILVGQGLENDLRALKLYHPHCVDTSNMFTGTERRVKLKLLAKEYLNRDIQCGSKGHDSIEDAVAAVDLFKLKLEQGETLRNFYVEKECKNKKVFELRESIFQAAQELNKKTCVVDTRTTLKKFKKEPVSCVVCSNDAEICKKACGALQTSDFVCMQLHGYNNLLQGETISEENIESTLSLMDERVGKFISALPDNTLHLTLMPGNITTREHSDPEKGDFKVRYGRCVIGMKVESIVYPGDR